MKKEIDISVSPQEAFDPVLLKIVLAEIIGIGIKEISFVKILKRSIDARSRKIKVHLKVYVFINEMAPEFELTKKVYPDISGKQAVIIVGAGPGGLFSALRLVELGFKPVILERGKTFKAEEEI